MTTSSEHPVVSAQLAERHEWTAAIASAQGDLARLALDPEVISGGLTMMADRVLAVLLAVCVSEAGALVSRASSRSFPAAQSPHALLAGRGMTLCDALSGVACVQAETLLSAGAPVAGAPSDGTLIILVARCSAETIDRARAILPAVADAAGAALSVALLGRHARLSPERDERTWLNQTPMTEEDAVIAGASGAEVATGVIRTMSHELRSPLATIKGYASTLLLHAQRLDPAEQRAFLEAIDRAADRLTETIARILDYSEISSGAPLPMVVINLASVARDALHARMASMPAIGPAAAPRMTLSAGAAPLLVRADPRRLRQALDNLLDNAVQYSPRGGAISLSLSTERADATGDPPGRRLIHIIVRDEGMGIPAEELTAIFREYHRVDRGLTRESEGLGLGLSIAKRIVELHGGALWAESVLGRGSAFHMTIPAHEEAHDDEAWRSMA